MDALWHLIYYSRATVNFGESELAALLRGARENNERQSITGMLLYAEGSFFQVLEGEQSSIAATYHAITLDPRHESAVTIIHEPIPQRAFEEWTMGSASMPAREVAYIVGSNDFFEQGSCFANLDSGRAKKLLAAFKEGRWRARLNGSRKANLGQPSAPMRTAMSALPSYSYAFQPIINASLRKVVSYEALIRGLDDQPAWQVLQQVPSAAAHSFDAASRTVAIALALRLRLCGRLHLNFLPMTPEKSLHAITALLEATQQLGIEPKRLTLELDEAERFAEQAAFKEVLLAARSAGLGIAIDNFGARHASLNLLDQVQPDLIALNPNLIRNIEQSGARQAIFHGIAQTCTDLGIELMAKGVENHGEYCWLREHGVVLFQGYLFAVPQFEALPEAHFPSEEPQHG